MMIKKLKNMRAMSRGTLSIAVAAGGLFATISCSGAEGIEGDETVDVDPVEQEVGNGLNAGVCAWPTSTWIGNCTATLVHPRLVLFAAHCSANHSYVNFGETSNGTRVTTTRCRTNPGYTGAGNDWAYCILSRDINLPITPALPRSCAEPILSRTDAKVVLAGFGAHQSGSAGIKRWNWADVRRANWTANVLELGYGDSSTPATGCPGDSGGPAFVRLGDGTWWTTGIASTLIGACGGTSSWNQYSLVGGGIRWVEQDSGIDITPCHDDAGNWAPTAACRNIYSANPGSGSGNWSSEPWCQGTPAVQQPTSCGSAPPPPPPSGSAANLFQHCNFTGWQASLGAGNYTTAQLAALGAVNNDASSLQLTGGHLAVLYDGDNFTGTSLTVTANTSCFVAQSFNDRLSSLRVVPPVKLFQHCNFTGWQATFAPGDYTTAQLAAVGAVNNDASSLQIPAGYTVTLFDGDNFTGTSVTLTANTSCLVNNSFNDRLSSMRVRFTAP